MKKTILITLIMFFASSVMVKADINTVVKKQRMEESRHKIMMIRANEVFNIIVFTIKELQRKGVKFDIPDDTGWYSNGSLSSKLGGKVSIFKWDGLISWVVRFIPVGGNEGKIFVEVHPNNTISVSEVGDKLIFECSIFSSKCIMTHRKELKSAIIEQVENDTGK